jgi:hypothetical protein
MRVSGAVIASQRAAAVRAAELPELGALLLRALKKETRDSLDPLRVKPLLFLLFLSHRTDATAAGRAQRRVAQSGARAAAPAGHRSQLQIPVLVVDDLFPVPRHRRNWGRLLGGGEGRDVPDPLRKPRVAVVPMIRSRCRTSAATRTFPLCSSATRSAVSRANDQSESIHSTQCGIEDSVAHHRRVAAGHAFPCGLRDGRAGPSVNGTSGTSVRPCTGTFRRRA